jgi:hypothetical protein
MTPTFQNDAVAEKFSTYPPNIKQRLLELRKIIFDTAARIEGVGAIQETLKWGEPAYVTAETRSGSAIRIDWKQKKPKQYAMYFNCQTNLVETFRTIFVEDFNFEGNRALVFDEADVIPEAALELCVSAALTYHQRK